MKDNWIYRVCKIGMGAKRMGDFMYALIMTSAEIHGTLGIGIKKYTRRQNATNRVEVMVFIDPDKVAKFEEMTGVTLNESPKVHLNAH